MKAFSELNIKNLRWEIVLKCGVSRNMVDFIVEI
jgi:hypothetical protein